MRLEEAQKVLGEVDGSSYSYLKDWGLSTVREAIRTVWDRKSATKEDRNRADSLLEHIHRGKNF